MHDVSEGPEAGLGAGAVSALQSLHGEARANNAIDANHVSTNASNPVGLPNPASDGTPTMAAGDLAIPRQSSTFVPATPRLGKIGPIAGLNDTTIAAATLTTPVGKAPMSHYVAIQGISPGQSRQFHKPRGYPETKPGMANGSSFIREVEWDRHLLETPGNVPGRPLPKLAYSLSGTNLTDPIKVYITSTSSGTTHGL